MELDLVYQLARPEDYEEVMGMSEGIYQGNDYLPSMYHDWLKDPNRTVLLAKLRGKIVALESLLLLDGGETALVNGLRVAPEYRGRGVAGLIQRHTLEYVRGRHPGLVRKRVARSDASCPAALKGHRLLFTRVILQLSVTSEAMATTVAQAKALTDLSLSREIQQSEAEAVLQNPSIVDALLPARIFVVNWVPFRSDPVNFPALRHADLTWTTDNPREPTVLSASDQGFPIPKEGRWWRQDVDIYSSSGISGLAGVNAHVTFHLERAVAAAPRGNSVVLFVSVERALADEVHDFWTQILGSAMLINRLEQMLLEVDL